MGAGFDLVVELLGEKWCRGAELNCLRRPFQGRALPVSYLGTDAVLRFYGKGSPPQSENLLRSAELEGLFLGFRKRPRDPASARSAPRPA